MSLEIVITPEANNGKRILIEGSLDSNTSSNLQQSIDANINNSVKTTILDFEKLEFLSSAGLRVIFKVKKRMENNGGKFLMVNLQPQIIKVFEIIKAIDSMSIFKDQAELDAYLKVIQDKVIDGE